LLVNGEAQGDAFLVRADGELWLRTNHLAGAGLVHATGGTKRTFNGETYVALSSLAPDVTFTLDEVALELRLTATPEMFETHDFVLQNERPPDIEYGSASGFFLNYDVNAQQSTNTAVTLEAGLSIKRALFDTTYTRTADNAIVRGLSSLTIDAPGSMVRFVAGDTIAKPTLLGSLPTVGGMSVGREFALDPYRVPYPLPGISGAVSTAATADVYVNGTLVRRQPLAPGGFSLQRLPLVGGLGNVQVVVRDRLGREQTFGGPYYFTSALLEKGTHDFQYLIGAAREDQVDANPVYKELTGSFFHRIGVTDWLTLGARAEGDPHVVSGGPMLNVRFGRLGELEAELAASRASNIVDYAAAASYTFTARWFTFSALGTWLRPHFASLDLGVDDPRHALQAIGTASASLGRLTATLSYRNDSESLTTPSQPSTQPVVVASQPGVADNGVSSLEITPERSAGLALFLQITSRTQVSVSASKVISELAPKGWKGFASLSVLLGARAVATAGANQLGDGVVHSIVTAQKSLPLGTGIGYRFEGQTATDGTQTARGEFQVQGRHGLISLREDSVQGVETASAELSGSLVAAGGQLRFGRTITEGYAVVQVEDNPGVRVYVNNQLAGRTGRGGSIVVPDLLPYYANPVRIADEDIALEYQLERTTAVVAPPNRGPALVRFSAKLFRGVSGRIVLIDGGKRIVPAYGDVSVDLQTPEPQTSPLGEHGEFYLENVQAGTVPLSITFGDISCQTTVDVPKEIRIAVDVGEVTCELRKP
jgi:outer membrane usher protein